MTELTDLNDTDALNTAVTGQSTEGNTANMGGMDNLFQATLGMLSRFRNSNIFRLRDNTDKTKLLAFDLSGLPAGTTTMAIPSSGQFLPKDVSFQTTVAASGGVAAAWTLTTTPVGASRDALLINHTLDAASNGVHVLGTVNSGVSGGQAGGFAMNGPGTASALVGNRYEDGAGNAVQGARVGTGAGWAGQFGYSSEGAGGGVYALKQPSGYTGLSGTGPALLVENISTNGLAIESSTAATNTTAASNNLTRLNSTTGIILDARATSSTARTADFTGIRAAIIPQAAWSGSAAVIGLQSTLTANITGSSAVYGVLSQSSASGNTTNYAVYGIASGANGHNYGGWFSAVNGTANTAIYASGNATVTGSLSKGSGTFLIDHPLDPLNKDLLHGFVEAPRYDLIYRGVAQLVGGRAVIDIDAASNMTEGTFAELTFNAVVSSLQNQEGFARLRPGPIEGGQFEIICEDDTCTDLVAWVVIAERNDAFVKSELDPNTDSDGRFVPERDKEE